MDAHSPQAHMLTLWLPRGPPSFPRIFERLSYTLFQSSRADVATIVHIFKANAVHGSVGFVDRILKPGCPRGHAQNAPAARIKLAVAAAGTGVEDLYVFELGRAVQSCDFLS